MTDSGGDHSIAVQSLAYAALDALRASVPVDLCAYLHAADGSGPQLYLRAPDLARLDASSAFDLFTALRDALDGGTDGTTSTRIAGFDAVAVVTAGATSRGLFVAGRRGELLTPDEERMVTAMCSAIGSACHLVEAGSGRRPSWTPVRVAVSTADGVVKATVALTAGSAVREGGAEAASPTTAVAEATLSALGTDLKLVDAAEGSIAGERVVLALVMDDAGRTAVGATLAGADPLRAAATATAEASARLSS